ncbi:hypothetical protein FGO68_gene1398 [Halteria grandinella]|uniref:Sfi1 spindle body domain-containing protein n=1 Tax=Halteria grandinella TaxID=5974 RepID=A0A8J8T9N1_HALGN|nr:hypothetical protein FGO68_gene1398 [Halteria grandinella]
MYYKKSKKASLTKGFESTRSITAASPSSANMLQIMMRVGKAYEHNFNSTKQISLKDEIAQDSLEEENPNNTTIVTQLKTELKDKIILTRERFNMLKQRKRHEAQCQNGFSLDQNENGAYTSRSQVVNPLTYRSTQKGQATPLIHHHERRQTEDRYNNLRELSPTDQSDQIDRDEEAFPLQDVTPNQFSRNTGLNHQQAQSQGQVEALNLNIMCRTNLSKGSGLFKIVTPIQEGQKTSYYRSYQSMLNLQQHKTYFKFEAAKKIHDKIDVVQKASIKDAFKELLNFDGKFGDSHFLKTARPNQLPDVEETGSQGSRREKWKFVKSVVKSIEKQKKQNLTMRGALIDRTNVHLNSTSQLSRVLDAPQSPILADHVTQRQSQGKGQENQQPTGQVMKREKSAGMLSTANQYKRKRDLLPPTIPQSMRKKEQVTQRMSSAVLYQYQDDLKSDEEEFANYDERLDAMLAETHRQVEPRLDLNFSGTLPNRLLQTRCNILGDEEPQEGHSRLPMESPVGADKLMNRSRLYLNEFINQHLADENQIKASLSKLAEIKRNSRQSASKEKQNSQQASDSQLFTRSKAHEALLNLLKRKVKEDRLSQKYQLKKSFAKFANYAKKISKLEKILIQTYQRHIERTFDKIKEVSWYREERKLALESVILKKTMREYISQWKALNNKHQLAQLFLQLRNRIKIKMQRSEAFQQWKQFDEYIDQKERRSSILLSVLIKHQYKRSGFKQFKQRCQIFVRVEEGLAKLNGLFGIKLNAIGFQKLLEFQNNQSDQLLKGQVLQSLFQRRIHAYCLEGYQKWKNLTSQLQQINAQRLRMGTYLVIKPILRRKARLELGHAFKTYKRKVQMIKQIELKLKLALKTFHKINLIQTQKCFLKWQNGRQTENLPKLQLLQSQLSQEEEEQLNPLQESSLVPL